MCVHVSVCVHTLLPAQETVRACLRLHKACRGLVRAETGSERQRKRKRKSEMKKHGGAKEVLVVGNDCSITVKSFCMMPIVLQMYFSATGRHDVQ